MPFARSRWTNIITLSCACKCFHIVHGCNYNMPILMLGCGWCITHGLSWMTWLAFTFIGMQCNICVKNQLCLQQGPNHKYSPPANICWCLLFMNPKFLHRLWY
jgi:hypothetical protein